LGKTLGRGIYCSTNSTLTLQNSILANNSTNSSPNNASGPILDGGNNISSDGSCNFTNTTSFNNTDPFLGPLDDYGGSTPTMPLLAGSPAIDNGNDAIAPPTDQRGHPRPFGAHSDIGAFESSPPYTIRGQVNSFSPITNAIVAAGNQETNLNADGTFVLSGLASGTYTITPALTNYVFTPINRIATVGPDIVGLDFEANQSTQTSVTNADLNSLKAALASLGPVVLAFDGKITLTSTFLITHDTSIDATGHQVTLSGDFQVLLFQVDSNATLRLRHVTLAFGYAMVPATNAAIGIPALGGAIRNDGGVVDVDDCKFYANTAVGGSSLASHGVNGSALGADIYNGGGVLNASNTVFLGGLLQGGGVSGGSGTGGRAAGGSIFNDGGSVTLVNCTFSLYRAVGGPLFLMTPDPYATAGDALGGALFTRRGTLGCWNCTFSTNDVMQNSPGWSFAQGGTIAGGGLYVESGTASLSACRFLNNQAQGGFAQAGTDGLGGGISNAGLTTLSNCVFGSNHCSGGGSVGQGVGVGPLAINAGRGGAVFNSGSLIAVNSLFTNNVATRDTLYGVSGPGGAGFGGGIYNFGTLSLVNCCLAGNQAIGGDGSGFEARDGGGGGSGGAIYAEAGIVGLTNLTLAANLSQGGIGTSPGGGAGGDGQGAGLFVASASVQAVNATLANNLAQGGEGGLNSMFGTNSPIEYGQSGNGVGAGIYCSTNGRVLLLNTIVASHSGSGNASGPILDGGNNLSSDGSCSFTNATSLNNTDPVLGPLDDYGGPTPTMPLLAGSPAIDNGNDAVAPATDQRGHPRPFGSHSDIGAFESSPPYTIRGRVNGFWALTNVSVHAGSLTPNIGGDGRFDFEGLPPTTYVVVPSLTNYVFVPASQTLSLGPDVVGLQFKPYRWSGLTPEPSTNMPGLIIFAGQAGQNWEIDRSTDLVHWQPLLTNTIPASGLMNFDDPALGPLRVYRAKQR
jgi:hypothetical protein